MANPVRLRAHLVPADVGCQVLRGPSGLQLLVGTMSTPEEIEVARRNLIAQLKAGYSESMEYVRLDLQTVRDLIEVLEAS